MVLVGVIVGLFLGWLFFHSSQTKETTPIAKEHKHEIWTCSMHPQIKMEKPGKCPICAMDLIPLKTDVAVNDSTAVQLSEDAIQLANVATTTVSRQNPTKEIRLYGKVQADERMLQNQVAHVGGRIEKLMLNFTGEQVRKGQLLAIIYSPDLVTAQQEFIEAAKTKASQPELYHAAMDKLMQWMLSDRQIAQIEKSGKVKTNFEVYSNTSGIVTARRVNTGDHVAEGAVLYEVANLSSVWVQFDAYESDLAFLKVGDALQFSVQSVPGKLFSAKIRFIDPVLDAAGRVARVRVEVPNADGRLKPEMYANAVVHARLDAAKDKLVIPRSAVLWTGKRSVVYLKTGEGQFHMQEIELGPALGNSYVVLSGLNEGAEIVTDGAFNVDAAAQLEGKPSMMGR
jgi:Cu(I)/Ag(I) efflux system membrane fusion protein